MAEFIIVLVVVASVVLFLLLRQKISAPKPESHSTFMSLSKPSATRMPINNSVAEKVQSKPSFPQQLWLEDKVSNQRVLCKTLKPGDLSLFQKTSSETSAHVHPIALNSFIQGVPSIIAAIQDGTIVQIIGPPDLLVGLKSGVYHTLQSGGHLGSVADSHGIVGNLRFSDPASVRSLAVPAAIFQVASAVTLQYYLHQMNDNLASIQQSIEKLTQRQQNTRYAAIMAARATCKEVREVLSDRHLPNVADEVRVNSAIDSISKEYQESQKSIEDFAAEVADVESNKDVKKMAHLLNDGSDSRLYDAQLLLASIVVRIELYHLKHELDLYLYPERLESNAKNIVKQVDSMKTAYEQLQETFEQVECFDDIIQGKTRLQKIGNFSALRTRNFNSKKKHFQEATKDLRDLIQHPFPEQDVHQPFMIECRIDANGNLESRYAMIAVNQAVCKKQEKI